MFSQFAFIFSQYSYQATHVSNSVLLPHAKSNGHRPLKFDGNKVWNNLPGEMLDCTTKDTFKLNCKMHLMEVVQKEEKDDFVY